MSSLAVAKPHALYRIPWNYKSLALGIGGRSGKRDTVTMLWDPPDMWELLRSVIVQPPLQDDRAPVLRAAEAKAASFREKASNCGSAPPALDRNGDNQGGGPPSDSPRMLVWTEACGGSVRIRRMMLRPIAEGGTPWKQLQPMPGQARALLMPAI
ncbi:hypothetical protein ST47_g6575 [Ascochyta rabiei]|uniref:Uncharacterized protein n=1 Tax=Didymella rabiei TaxID=5454 RepID=A0A163C9Y7_DIDRA|nr:hypothetical protein ST47_g6575 [Ascochyta rabiei]